MVFFKTNENISFFGNFAKYTLYDGGSPKSVRLSKLVCALLKYAKLKADVILRIIYVILQNGYFVLV